MDGFGESLQEGKARHNINELGMVGRGTFSLKMTSKKIERLLQLCGYRLLLFYSRNTMRVL